MTVSSFKPTADFGIFTCFTIVTGAFLDIVIDPILLGFMSPRGGRNAEPTVGLSVSIAGSKPTA